MSVVSKYLAAIGRRGGKAGTGKAKAQARAAAKARWAKVRALRQNEKLTDAGPVSKPETAALIRRSSAANC